MELTKRQQYGLRGLAYLAGRAEGEAASVPEISRATGVPVSYLMKIFQDLTRVGLVAAHRGAKGGFSLARPAEAISLREILEACGGPLFSSRCLLGNPICSDEIACAIHAAWFEAQGQFIAALEVIPLSKIVRPSALRIIGDSTSNEGGKEL
ncbi:MAG: Rrf2 family transcriptional regulator [Armatimonadetes bacterium]|nr:Rrf2 family transcriptional regulator [Armatimonadota bacterium]